MREKKKLLYPGDMTAKDIKSNEELAKKFPEFKTKYWLCLLEMDYSFGKYDEWDIYTEEQNGYKWAKQKVPYFTEEDIDRLELSDD